MKNIRFSWLSRAATFGLWFYAGILWFVWFVSGVLPDVAVLVRIGTSFVSDLVWLPFGFAVWGAIIFLAVKLFSGGRAVLSVLTGTVVSAVFHSVSPEISFKFLLSLIHI